jgi:anti-sigma regulatory factor (Ser/Thr protein kinase)
MEPDCRLTAWATEPSDLHGSISMRIRGGLDAPNRARRSVLSQLATDIPQTTASDVAVVVSELVTNSVLHANVGPGLTLTVVVVMVDDRLRISVIDPGSRLEPRILPPDPQRVGGIGLFLVNELSEAWGVARDGTGRTRVWCDILLHRPRSSGPRVVDSESASVAPS